MPYNVLVNHHAHSRGRNLGLMDLDSLVLDVMYSRVCGCVLVAWQYVHSQEAEIKQLDFQATEYTALSERHTKAVNGL